MRVLSEQRSPLDHAPTCATGARAETRSTCDCGAVSKPAAWTVQVIDVAGVVCVRTLFADSGSMLSGAEAVMLSLSLQAASREVARLAGRRSSRAASERSAVCPRCSSRLAHALDDCTSCGWKLPLQEPTPKVVAAAQARAAEALRRVRGEGDGVAADNRSATQELHVERKGDS